MRQVIGVLLIVVGVAYIAFNGFRYSASEKVLDVGPLEATTQTTREVVPYSPVLGGAVVIGGALLFIAGFRRPTT